MELRIVGCYDADLLSTETGLDCRDETLTHQEFKEESDINTIIDRFGIGENPIEAQKWVTNVDISEAPDNYMDVMNQLNAARDQFMSLPARVRSRFENDPGKFVAFVSDRSNLEEMYSLGLAVKPPVLPDIPAVPPAKADGTESS